MSDWLARVLSREPGYELDLVERYTQPLLGLARRQLPERVRRRVDPEDVVQSVYRSFFRRLNEDRFAFEESHDVWRLLAVITFHKARNAVKFHQRSRRDVRRDQGAPAGEESTDLLGELADVTPRDEDVTVLFECLESLLTRLPDNYREIVVRRLEGASIEEVALAVHRSRRTVLRVLAHVQELAVRELESP